MTEGAEPRPTDSSSRALFADVAKVYCVVLVVIIAFAIAATFVGLVAELLYAIVAFLFFFVPQRILEKRREDPAEYGLVAGNVPRGILWGVGATLLTLPFFLPGYWIWETYFLERSFDLDMARYRQWSIEHDGEPESWGQQSAGVWIWSDRDVLNVGIRNDGSPNNRVRIRADSPFEPVKRGTVNIAPANDDGTEWIATLTHSRSRGVVSIRGPDSATVFVEPITKGNPVWPMYHGPRSEPVEAGQFSDERGLWWLALWVATQFVLVAFPEEYFYRGFVQTRLERGFEARARERGRAMRAILGFTPAILLTSLLFGVGHLVVPVGGVLLANRMAVFFPSLLFGWLRRHTDSILAPTIYHAMSNMMVLVAAVHFV